MTRRILNLARGATLLDAACLLRAPNLDSHGGLVNGMPAAPSTVLQNGDIVSLERREPLVHYGQRRAASPLQRPAAATAPRLDSFHVGCVHRIIKVQHTY